MTLQIIVTAAGRAALLNASHTGTLPVTVTQVGISPTSVVPTPAANVLPGELKRLATFGGAAVAADIMHLLVRDESTDAYSMKSFALYLGDGTLFAIYGQADPIIAKVAPSIMLLAVDVQFADITATSIAFGDTNFVNPPATTTTQGVVELADDTEAQALADALRALTPRGLGLVFTAAKILQQVLTVDGAGSGLDADLLDGQQGSYYLAAGTYTAANVLAKLVTVDGSGSGLDADLLDGQHGSYYLAAASYTAADIRAKLLTVDGSESGIDADLLDGSEASEFARLSGAAFLGGVSTGGDLVLTRTNDPWAFIMRPDVAGYRNLSFACVSGASLDNFEVRSKSNVRVSAAGTSAMWDAGNDGSGSGLDADLLDGQHGSYYLPASSYTAADIRAKLLTVDGAGSALDADLLDGQHGSYYLAAGSYTAADVLAKMVTVDGSGSGLDADLLDGQQGAWYADIAGRLGFTPVQQGTGIGQNTNTIKIGWSAALRLKATVDNSDLGAIVTDSVIAAQTLDVNGAQMRRGGNHLWGPENDGSGSGMDADLLDGRHASEFALLSQFGVSAGGTGFQRLPSGLIIQWGTASHSDGSGAQPINFPTPFPNNLLCAVASNGASGPPAAFHGIGGNSPSGMIVYSAQSATVPAGAGTAFTWIAIGY